MTACIHIKLTICCYCVSMLHHLLCTMAYDQATIKFCEVDADINFTLDDYKEDMKKINNFSKEEFFRFFGDRASALSEGACGSGVSPSTSAANGRLGSASSWVCVPWPLWYRDGDCQGL